MRSWEPGGAWGRGGAARGLHGQTNVERQVAARAYTFPLLCFGDCQADAP